MGKVPVAAVPRRRSRNIRLSPVQSVPSRYWIYPPSIPSEVARPLVSGGRHGGKQIPWGYCLGCGILQPQSLHQFLPPGICSNSIERSSQQVCRTGGSAESNISIARSRVIG